MRKKHKPSNFRSLPDAINRSRFATAVSFAAGLVDGLSGVSLVLAPAKGMVGRRYVSLGIAGDWAAIGHDIEIAEHGYPTFPDVKKRA